MTEKDHFHSENASRYGLDNIDPYEYAIYTTKLKSTWIEKSNIEKLQHLFKSKDSKDFSETTQLKILVILVILVKALVKDIEDLQRSDYLTMRGERKGFNQDKFSKHINDHIQDYYKSTSTHGLSSKTIAAVLSEALKNR